MGSLNQAQIEKRRNKPRDSLDIKEVKHFYSFNSIQAIHPIYFALPEFHTGHHMLLLLYHGELPESVGFGRMCYINKFH